MLGDLLEVFAVIAWGGYMIASKPLVGATGRCRPWRGRSSVGAGLDLPIAVATGRWNTLGGVSPTAWMALGYLVLVASIAGLLFQNLALGRLDASQVATFGNLSTRPTMLWGHLLFD